MIKTRQSIGRFCKKLDILKVKNNRFYISKDVIVIEAPLEIQIAFFAKGIYQKKNLAITMRTPGADAALAMGFLFSEGIIGKKRDIEKIEQLDNNRLIIRLLKGVPIDLEQLERHFYTTSSCGVCGKASIAKVEKTTCYFPQPNLPKIAISVLNQLPKLLQDAQPVFAKTGGIHAAGLFDAKGNLLLLKEDVGRHNAVDKLIGQSLQNNWIPLRSHLLLLSGRISFELVQKAMMAGIPIIAAMGAPSSLAVELAKETGITIIGFLRENRFNIYTGSERLL